MRPRPDDGTLQAYLDGELSEEEADAVRWAARTQPEVARRLEELRDLERETDNLLGALDDPGFPRRQQQAEERIFGKEDSRREKSRVGLRRAAAIALLVVVGGGVVLAAQPVRDWLSARLGTPEEAVDVRRAPETAPVAGSSEEVPDDPPALPLETTELAVQPADGRIDVVLDEIPAGVRITVELGAQGAPLVRAGADAHFRTGLGLLEVRGATRPVRIRLPGGLEHARLRVNGQTYLEIRGPVLSVTAPGAERQGNEVTFVVERGGNR